MTPITVKHDNNGTLHSATDILEGNSGKGFFTRILPFLGPAFVASVAYLDPGNFAANIQGGARFGYTLLWVIIASNIMAMLLQSMSAKLGIATGKNLAEHCRERFPRAWVWIMWFVAEIAAIATDLAEFIGAAIGFQLLFSIPLIWGAVLSAITTMLILSLDRYGFRPLEAVISSFVGVISLCYLTELMLGSPDWKAVGYHAFTPQFSGTESIILASAILGATVMPHAIFLHSALTQDRIVVRDDSQLRMLFHYELLDVFLAMGVAGLVNAAMLIMAAMTFHTSGMTEVGTMEEAYKTLKPLLGQASGIVFAISLLASGLSSSTVGTMSGQIIMKGFLDFQVPSAVRRIITMAPSLAIIAWGFDPTRALVLSQVVLSFALPFAVIPLILLSSDRTVMGTLVNHKSTTVIASLVATIIICLNAFLLYCAMFGE